ncbi:MAG: hypothetical protein WCA27_30070 [Candidatus Sulfotelmatobacter sp.]
MAATRLAKKDKIGEINWDRVHPNDHDAFDELNEQIEAAEPGTKKERLQEHLFWLIRQLENKPPGRPRLFPKEKEAEYREMYLVREGSTLRTLQNRMNWAHALRVLCDGPMATVISQRWVWLLRPNRYGVAESRETILSELGRVKQDEALKVFADALCERKPRAQHAIRMLRRWRNAFDFLLSYDPWNLEVDYAELAKIAMQDDETEQVG